MASRSVAFLTACSAIVMASVLVSKDALAADRYAAPTFTPVPISTWEGGYFGGSIGAGGAEVSGIFDAFEAFTEDRVDHQDFDIFGVTGTVHAGYNAETASGLVYGIEADWSFVDWSDTVHDADIEGSLDTTDRATYDIEWIATLRGRLGVAVGRSGNSLIYATAGAAYQEASYEQCDCDGGPEPVITGVDFDDIGFVAGGGLEHKVSETYSVRTEALYFYWGDERIPPVAGKENGLGDFARLDDAFMVRVGGSIHFPPQ